MLDKGVRAGLRVAPVTVGDARPAGPDFTDAVWRQRRQALRIDDHDCVLGLSGAAAHHLAAIARHNAMVSQRQLVHTQRRDAKASLAACDKERGFGQTVRREVTVGTKPTRCTGLSKALKGVLANGF